jgi:hypothetical protein
MPEVPACVFPPVPAASQPPISQPPVLIPAHMRTIAIRTRRERPSGDKREIITLFQEPHPFSGAEVGEGGGEGG